MNSECESNQFLPPADEIFESQPENQQALSNQPFNHQLISSKPLSSSNKHIVHLKKYDDQSRNQQKAGTKLQIFLASMDQVTYACLAEFINKNESRLQKSQSQKISLIEDAVMIMEFKKNEEQLLKNKNKKAVAQQLCEQISLRIHRKPITIKERIEKKLCNLSISELQNYLLHDLDISFNKKNHEKQEPVTHLSIDSPGKSPISICPNKSDQPSSIHPFSTSFRQIEMLKLKTQSLLKLKREQFQNNPLDSILNEKNKIEQLYKQILQAEEQIENKLQFSKIESKQVNHELGLKWIHQKCKEEMFEKEQKPANRQDQANQQNEQKEEEKQITEKEQIEDQKQKYQYEELLKMVSYNFVSVNLLAEDPSRAAEILWSADEDAILFNIKQCAESTVCLQTSTEIFMQMECLRRYKSLKSIQERCFFLKMGEVFQSFTGA